eukprot:GHVT01098374.1.p2 GENE.GHVT01098374.1~~GHVT01098374.1.p2  ORF type:complete len:132 (-),score=1.14 GHVT01098374.1:84-479(-)
MRGVHTSRGAHSPWNAYKRRPHCHGRPREVKQAIWAGKQERQWERKIVVVLEHSKLRQPHGHSASQGSRQLAEVITISPKPQQNFHSNYPPVAPWGLALESVGVRTLGRVVFACSINFFTKSQCGRMSQRS